jgi:hypothetical protein
LLRRILRLRCAALCATGRPVEVIVRRLGVVFQTYLGIVPYPQRDDVNREGFE